ncbi:MAG TPA: GNAT family N-acetyltransferase [Steroidobacteraceae bacterium]|jgi:GNAT superfamily N-acetyltransferase|nr:GNAT family N-acetyltransferase [Steroidobacteraceae bacterium]
MRAVLRQAVRRDLPDLLRVRRAVSENRLFLLTMTDEQLVEALESTGRGWVIELDGTIVAFAIGDALTGGIWALFVDPPHRGQGYGRRLYDTVVEWLRLQGSDPVWPDAQPSAGA